MTCISTLNGRIGSPRTSQGLGDESSLRMPEFSFPRSARRNSTRSCAHTGRRHSKKTEDKEMTDQTHKAEQFRRLHVPGKPLILFNIWDAGGAKAVASGGAKALATGSWSVAHSNRFEDCELVPHPMIIHNLRRSMTA